MAAKNHALVLPDADKDQVINAIVGAAFGAAVPTPPPPHIARLLLLCLLRYVGLESSVATRLISSPALDSLCPCLCLRVTVSVCKSVCVCTRREGRVCVHQTDVCAPDTDVSTHVCAPDCLLTRLAVCACVDKRVRGAWPYRHWSRT